MFRMDIAAKQLVRLEEKTLTELGLWERDDLEAMIASSFEAFCKDLGLKWLLVGKQFYVSDEIKDHGDLLALDKEGKSVIVELKRNFDDNQLYQALTYASMVAEWDLGKFARELANRKGTTTEEATEEISGFLDIEGENLNERQAVYLLAEDFDYQTLVTAKWLREKHGVDVSCVRLDVSKSGNELFLSFVLIYPTPGLQEHAVNVRRREPTNPSDWETALKAVRNPAVADYFRAEIAANREAGESLARLYYRVGGKRRFYVNLKRDDAYVWQTERFLNDLDFLKQRLGESAEVEAVNADGSVRFYLKSKEQFAAFKKAATEEIKADWFDRQHTGGEK
jgi:hypothetical protein